jgi:hypothetical protein
MPSPMALIQVRNPSDDSNWLVLETNRGFDEPVSPGQERFDFPYRHVHRPFIFGQTER